MIPSLAACAASSLLFLLAGLASADQPSWLNSQAYEEEEYGRYPTQNFKSSDRVAARVNLVRQHEDCANDMLTFFTPRGYVGDARKAQASIFTQDGYLVWTTPRPRSQLYNLMVQEWKGKKYLTFWAGNDAVGGHGAGNYYIYDQTYKMTLKMSAANKLAGDLHEFYFTDEGTVLMTVYDVVDRDLSALGKSMGPIWDCLIQEVDLETGELVFQWRASDHLKIADTYRNIGGEGTGGSPFDWFHINSIEKDPEGNYIISSRYLHTVTKIEGGTGKVLWILGGKSNMFSDLSEGNATNFGFQHHARWARNYTQITLFDNNSDGGNSKPRGLRVAVDQEAMTVRLVNEYLHPQHFPAQSQGSMQVLPNGNVLLGYGYSGAWSEFTHDGKILCDTHFGPVRRYGSGDAQSYRVFKFDWQGFPYYSPSVTVARDEFAMWRAYVSWNGATEVRQWVLQGADSPDAAEPVVDDGDAEDADEEDEEAMKAVEADADREHWYTMDTLPRVGFETSFLLHNGHPPFLRIQGLDASGKILGTTNVTEAAFAKVDYQTTPAVQVTKTQPCDETEGSSWRLPVFLLAAAFTGLVAGLLARPALKALGSWEPGRRMSKYIPLPIDDGEKMTRMTPMPVE